MSDIFDNNNNFGDFGFKVQNFDSEEILNQESQLVLKNVKKKKTVNTYITGFKMSKEELKPHHTILKKKFGCGGSLKLDNKENLVFHLSYGGEDENKEIIQYFIEKLSIDKNNIKVEG